MGLTAAEVMQRRAASGPNRLPEVAERLWSRALRRFWAPVPWMLEAAIILELALGRTVEALIIATLLVFNAVLGVLQEGRAQATLAALTSRLALRATVRRDGAWSTIPAAELVPGDVMKLSLGGMIAADVRIISGEVLVDQSTLTGESVPVEVGTGAVTYAGALIRRGEAMAEVTATGAHTTFGRSAALIRSAHAPGSQQRAVLRVVRLLAVFNGAVVAAMIAFAVLHRMPLHEIIPMILTAILASIPVALPATFTLASAVGARALAAVGVLPTRLSAVDEAATMEVLCADKTGTLTRNALTIDTVRPAPGYEVSQVLALAALSSSEAGLDPVDAAIRQAALPQATPGSWQLRRFVPFDPATKMAQALVADPTGAERIIYKGAWASVSALAAPVQELQTAGLELSGQGLRVLAVASGPREAVALVGLIALSDPPRVEAADLIRELAALGVRTVMVTGDAAATAAHVAVAVGLPGPVWSGRTIPPEIHADSFAVYAGVLPEDKFALVTALQHGGHTVGMCGDGANDAPALRQAQLGIAVSTATDVAKAAAGMVLTRPGLGGVISAVREGRRAFQRILTYTLNSIIKKFATVLFLGAGLLITGQAILTPLLMVIVMVAGDVLSMALTTDRVRPTPRPDVWRIRSLGILGAVLGSCLLAYCLGALMLAGRVAHLGPAQLQTVSFVVLVFGGQATIYAVRERQRWWSSRPSAWLAAASILDVLVAASLSIGGIAMQPVAAWLVGSLLVLAVILSLLMDAVKAALVTRLWLS